MEKLQVEFKDKSKIIIMEQVAIYFPNYVEDLYKSLDQKIDSELCLISAIPLKKDHIKLVCGHKFNYESIILEVIKQKKLNLLETQKIKKQEIKCPYCRNIQRGILPYSTEYGKKIRYVNWPIKYAYSHQKCSYFFKSGIKKNQKCNKICFGEKCIKHVKTKNIKQCCGILKSGINKGKKCSYKALVGDYCKKHSKK